MDDKTIIFDYSMWNLQVVDKIPMFSIFLKKIGFSNEIDTFEAVPEIFHKRWVFRLKDKVVLSRSLMRDGQKLDLMRYYKVIKTRSLIFKTEKMYLIPTEKMMVLEKFTEVSL